MQQSPQLNIPQYLKDQFLQQITQLPSFDEKTLRQFIAEAGLTNKQKDEFNNWFVNNNSTDNLVFKRMFIADILENDIYMSVTQKQGNVWVHLFGQLWDEKASQEEEDVFIFSDRSNCVGVELEKSFGMKKTNKKYILRFYSGKDEPITPKIYNIINLVGFHHSSNNIDIIDVIYFTGIDPIYKAIQMTNLKQTYQQLLDMVEGILQDKLATTWLLMTLLRNQHSKEIDEIGGFLSVNFYNISKVEKIINFLQQIYSPVLFVPLSIEFLHKQQFQSCRDIELNELKQGYFQIPVNYHTLILVDETQMQPGALQEKGIINLQHLQVAISQNRMFLDYNYSQVELKLNQSSIIFSHGKSFLQGPLKLPIQPSQVIEIEQFSQSPEEIEQFIHMIHQRQLELEINQQLQQQINDVYVNMRIQYQSEDLTDNNQHLEVNAESLSRWVGIMKILSAVNEEQECQFKYFEEAIVMDKERVKRLNIKQ